MCGSVNGSETEMAKPCDLVEVALGYVLAAPEVSSVIVGTRKLESVRTNLEATSKPVASNVISAARELARKVTVRAW